MAVGLQELLSGMAKGYGHPLREFRTYVFRDFGREVRYVPLSAEGTPTPYYWALLDGEPKGIVTKGYKVVLIEELLRIVGLTPSKVKKTDRTTEAFVDTSEIELPVTPYETIAGSVIVPRPIPLDRDRVKVGLWITTGYSGDVATHVSIGILRQICDNGATIREDFGYWRILHRQFLAYELLELLNRIAEKIEEKLQRMLSPVKEDSLKKLEELWEKSKLPKRDWNLLQREFSLIRKARGGEILRWDAVNAVWALATHTTRSFRKREKLYQLASVL